MKLPVPLRRIGYRLAYSILRVYWFTVRPRSRGVKCLLLDGERVLLVRHTYGPREWELPGGSLRRREPPVDGARREMREELGITIDDWKSLGDLSGRVYRRRDTLHCFQARIDGVELTIDRGEIDTAEWFTPDALPPRLGRYVRPVIAVMKPPG